LPILWVGRNGYAFVSCRAYSTGTAAAISPAFLALTIRVALAFVALATDLIAFARPADPSTTVVPAFVIKTVWKAYSIG